MEATRKRTTHTSRTIPGAPRPRSTTRRSGATATAEPTHDAIARRAYDLYLDAGGVHGRDVEFWLAAERELKGTRRA